MGEPIYWPTSKARVSRTSRRYLFLRPSVRSRNSSTSVDGCQRTSRHARTDFCPCSTSCRRSSRPGVHPGRSSQPTERQHGRFRLRTRSALAFSSADPTKRYRRTTKTGERDWDGLFLPAHHICISRRPDRAPSSLLSTRRPTTQSWLINWWAASYELECSSSKRNATHRLKVGALHVERNALTGLVVHRANLRCGLSFSSDHRVSKVLDHTEFKEAFSLFVGRDLPMPAPSRVIPNLLCTGQRSVSSFCPWIRG